MLSTEHKQSLYRDGFLILRGAVPEARVAAARRAIFAGLGKLRQSAFGIARFKEDDALEHLTKTAMATAGAGADPVFLDLFNGTELESFVEALIGEVKPIRGCQLASTFPTEPSETINEAGYADRDTPFHGWIGHLDGLWNGATRTHQRTDRPMTADEWDAWDQEPSTNGCVKCFPDQNANVASFTALAGVALSDQTVAGVGNLGLLKGGHLEMEKFFRWQRDQGGPLGPGGPGWERIDTRAPNGAGLRHYPDALREAFRADAEVGPDGAIWPKPTLLEMAPGDAAIVMHTTPHSATRVEGSDPRLMAYFRVTTAAREEGQRANPKALWDIWDEWPGMQDFVREIEGA